MSRSKTLTKNGVLQMFITQKIFENGIVAGVFANTIDNCCNIFVFVIRYQKTFSSAQPLKKSFEFDSNNFPSGIDGCVLQLIFLLKPNSSMDQRQLELCHFYYKYFHYLYFFCHCQFWRLQKNFVSSSTQIIPVVTRYCFLSFVG